MISILENDIDIASKKHNLVQFKDYFVKTSWLWISTNIRHQSNKKKSNESFRDEAKSENNENKMLNSATVIAAIDKFIGEILEGKEFSSSQLDPTPALSIADALIKELEFRQLPPVDLLTFDGCPTK